MDRKTKVATRAPRVKRDKRTAESLSTREREILSLIADGRSTKETAFALAISFNTVKKHMDSVLRKLEARNRTHAVAQAIRKGLI